MIKPSTDIINYNHTKPKIIMQTVRTKRTYELRIKLCIIYRCRI